MSAPSGLEFLVFFAGPAVWGYICGRYLKALLGLTFACIVPCLIMAILAPSLVLMFIVFSLPGYGIGLLFKRNLRK